MLRITILVIVTFNATVNLFIKTTEIVHWGNKKISKQIQSKAWLQRTPKYVGW